MKRIFWRIFISAGLALHLLFPIFTCQAADRGAINSGETRVNIALEGPSFMDTWTISGSVGERILIQAVTTSGSLDTAILLYPPDGAQPEATGWLTGYGGDSLDHQLQKTGDYTLMIKDHPMLNPGLYNLAFLKLPGNVTSTGDPDGGPIASAQTLTGRIREIAEMDAWQFEGKAGERVLIHAVTTSGSLDTAIILYPPNSGPAEAAGWLTGYGGDSLEVALAKTGLYTILIRDHALNKTGDYNVSFQKINGIPSSAEDPDGGTIQSAEIRTGRINKPAEMDVFQFYGQANERVLISALTTSGTLDTAIVLYPPDGAPAEASGWLTGYGGDSMEQRLVKTGIYSILIRDYALTGTGNYNICLQKIPGPVIGANSLFEDRDGGLLRSGDTVGGTINARGDLDVFQFYGKAGERVIIHGPKVSGTLDTALLLYPPDGTPAEASGWLTGYGGDDIDHQLLKTGLYSILVRDYHFDQTGGYNMSLVKLPSSSTGLYHPVPANGSVVSVGKATLAWDAVTGATSYQVFFVEAGLQPLNQVANGLLANTFQTPALEPARHYYWQVIAQVPGGNITGPVWEFSVQPPSLTIAKNAASVTLTWPLPATGFELFHRADVAKDPWLKVSVVPSVQGDRAVATIPASAAKSFFILKRP